jgi:hypothetical protein
MPQPKSQGTDDQDPGQPLQEESNQERCEEEGGAPPGDTQPDDDGGRGDGRVSRQRDGRDGRDGMRGRPAPNPTSSWTSPSAGRAHDPPPARTATSELALGALLQPRSP